MGPLGKISFTTNQLKLRSQELSQLKHQIDKISSIFSQRAQSIPSQPFNPKDSQNQLRKSFHDTTSTWSMEKKSW
jgi:hypothetical protein